MQNAKNPTIHPSHKIKRILLKQNPTLLPLSTLVERETNKLRNNLRNVGEANQTNNREGLREGEVVPHQHLPKTNIKKL
ncbi:hypothetical protein ACFL56_00585 [Candidatus Margulisiibacteriota bacterium]